MCPQSHEPPLNLFVSLQEREPRLVKCEVRRHTSVNSGAFFLSSPLWFVASNRIYIVICRGFLQVILLKWDCTLFRSLPVLSDKLIVAQIVRKFFRLLCNLKVYYWVYEGSFEFSLQQNTGCPKNMYTEQQLWWPLVSQLLTAANCATKLMVVNLNS